MSNPVKDPNLNLTMKIPMTNYHHLRRPPGLLRPLLDTFRYSSTYFLLHRQCSGNTLLSSKSPNRLDRQVPLDMARCTIYTFFPSRSSFWRFNSVIFL